MASEAQQAWLESVINGTPPKIATKEHFDCKTASSIAAKTSILKNKYAEDINSALLKQMKLCAPQAFLTIMDLAQTADQAAVKLKACQDILDRTGYKPSLQIEDVTEKAQSEEEILQSIQEEMKSMQEQGIDVLTLIKGTEH